MKTALVNQQDNLIYIRFKIKDTAEWESTLDFVKTNIIGRDFKKERKLWLAPALKENIEALKQFGFTVTGDEEPVPKEPWKDTHVNISTLEGLRPYQVEGLQFLQWREGRGLVTDEMGLGKTIQALSYLKINPKKRPVLIVCPATIKLQWKREWMKWIGEENIQVLSGEKPHSLEMWSGSSFIINWDILSNKVKVCDKCKSEIVKRDGKLFCDKCDKSLEEGDIINIETGWVLELQKQNFQVVIGDEIQALCNPKTNRTRAFKRLAKSATDIIGLSGTPIQNRPDQFFTALNLVQPQVFSNRWRYYERYCDLKNNGFGWTHKGATNTEELHELVSQVMIRRLKKDVLPELPKKNRVVVPLEVEGEKKEAVVRWVQDFLDSCDEKLVVFAWHIDTIDYIQEKFKDISVKVYGGTGLMDRDKAIKRFQEAPDIRLFVGNVIAAGVGVDGLQNVCSNAVVAELVYNPKALVQAEDRLHRINQEGSVNIYYLIDPEDKDDRKIMYILDDKTRMIDAVVDGVKTGDEDLLSKLMEE